jgi:glycine/D-amino acid oxidase-like deaminating enzyme
MAKHVNYWFETCPPKIKVSAGLIGSADILIIGGGVSGITLLAHLLRAGIQNVYLVEENTIAFHASGRSSGQIMLRGGKSFTEFEKSIGTNATIEYIKFISQNAKRFVKALEGVKFDTDLNVNGGIHLAVDDQELSVLKREYELIDKANAGIVPAMLSEKDVFNLIPSKKSFKGGLFIPAEATINPYKVVNGVKWTLDSKGSRILTNASVESVARNSDGTLVASIRNRGTIRAKKIVYCTNAYVNTLVPELANYMGSFRGQMIATDVLPDNLIEMLPTTSLSCNYGSEYFRLHGGRLLVGGMRHAIRGKQEGILADGEISKTVYNRLRDFLSDIFPALSNSIEYTWSGVMCSTKDSLPFVGKLHNRPNEYVMAGFNGYGFSHAFNASLIVKDLIVKGSSDLPGTKLFDPARYLY